MSEDPILTAIAKLGDDVRDEIAKLGDDLLAKINTGNEKLQTSLDGLHEDLTVIGAGNDRTRLAGQNTRDELRAMADSLANIERLLLKHGTRLDDLEKRVPPRA
jgi:hypothetical protein